MPALKSTDHRAEIVWLGLVKDRKSTLASMAMDSLKLCFEGPEGDTHSGLLRPACSRVKALYKRHTPIRNTRQLSIMSSEELEQIAHDMGLEALDPALVGASMVVRGLPDFSHVPPGSRLLSDHGACIVVDMENRPCTLPARVIDSLHPSFGARFKSAAQGRRGVTSWVEAEGIVKLGDHLRLFVPDQPSWMGDFRK